MAAHREGPGNETLPLELQQIDRSLPLVEQSLLPRNLEAEIYKQVATVQESGLFGQEEVESIFYTESAPTDNARSDFSEIHVPHDEVLRIGEIEDVRVHVGTFILNKALTEVVEEALAEQDGHFVDRRGSLTLLKQGDINRLRHFLRENPLPGLVDIFDLDHSQITSAYTSRTNFLHARDSEFEPGKGGIHVHPVQTDRFILTSGKWEILLFDLNPFSSTYRQILVLSYNAHQTEQLAFTIPPGVAHSVACFRDEDGARLVNFPTHPYGYVPEYLASMYDPNVGVRVMEGRLDPHRVTDKDGYAFMWDNYLEWLNGQIHQEEQALMAGGPSDIQHT